MTERIYYEDSHCYAFTARVTECRQGKKGWEAVLDRTAFFPEGGGQAADTGSIGAVRVKDVHIADGEIVHFTDGPLTVGETYDCRLDREQRFRRMQNHSGEHIFSGIVHSRWGYDNVGFHLGDEAMTVDFSGELSNEELEEAELAANRVVWADLPIITSFPEPEKLKTMTYRSKLELTKDVRIVEIPGVDVCACCAPHAAHTGEIGLIRVLDSMRHRGGTRVTLVCGSTALEYDRCYQRNIRSISGALSVKREDTAAAVDRLLAEKKQMGEQLTALSMESAVRKAEAVPATDGNVCLFETGLTEAAMREIVNRLMEKCRTAAVFCGSDSEGWRYIIGSRTRDLRAAAKEINAAIGGRGGGRPEMIQGNARETAQKISAFFIQFA